MFTRTVRLALTVLVSAGLTAGATGSQLAAQANPPAGPPYVYQTELMTVWVVPMNNAARITLTTNGYLFRAGMQNSRLRITPVPGGLRFHDRGTLKWAKLAPTCTPRKVRYGVAAFCKFPRRVSVAKPLLLEVWPRLGDDYIDGSALPATVAMTVLGDLGNDTVRTGAGPDFVNGAGGLDRVWGGGGNDWIRTGLGNDVIYGEAGDDWLVGVDGNDRVYGGPGNDRVGGSNGNDILQGDAGRDYVLCGDGVDTATVDAEDEIRDCENVLR